MAAESRRGSSDRDRVTVHLTMDVDDTLRSEAADVDAGGAGDEQPQDGFPRMPPDRRSTSHPGRSAGDGEVSASP
jgi:hypothetical protein